MFKIKKCIALAMATTAVIGTSGMAVYAEEDDDEMLGGAVQAVSNAVNTVVCSHPVVHDAVVWAADKTAQEIIDMVDAAKEIGSMVVSGAKGIWNGAVKGESMKDPHNPGFVD